MLGLGNKTGGFYSLKKLEIGYLGRNSESVYMLACLCVGWHFLLCVHTRIELVLVFIVVRKLCVLLDVKFVLTVWLS